MKGEVAIILDLAEEVRNGKIERETLR